MGTGTVGDGGLQHFPGNLGNHFHLQRKITQRSTVALHSFAHADGHYHLMGCMLSAASCNKWWMDEILRTKDYSGEQKDIEVKELGKNHVFFLPYLMGERSPHNDPNVRGTFIGMSMDTTREELTQAVLEGVVFGLRDSFEVAKSLASRSTARRSAAAEPRALCGGRWWRTS